MFCEKYFNNSLPALEHALSVGDVEVVQVGDKEYYSFVALENTHTRSKVASQKLLQTAKKIDGDTSKNLAASFDGLQFNFRKLIDPSIPNVVEGNSSSSTQTMQSTALVVLEVQPPVNGDDVFEKLKPVFEDAKAAAERIGRDLLKIVTKTGDDAQTTATLCLVANINSNMT